LKAEKGEIRHAKNTRAPLTRKKEEEDKETLVLNTKRLEHVHRPHLPSTSTVHPLLYVLKIWHLASS